MSNTIWKPVSGFEGYEVSNTGEVRSYLLRGRAGSGGKRREEPVLLKPATNRNGYRFVVLYRDSEMYNKKVHHLVLEAFVGPRPVGKETAHLNGKRDDNRLENLAWVTHKENMSHRVLHGTNIGPRGEIAGAAKLTNAQAIEIKTRLLAGESVEGVAADYPVDVPAIIQMLRGKAWKYVGPDVTVAYNPKWTCMDDAAEKEIVRRITDGRSASAVAKEMNVSVSTVGRAFYRQTGMKVRKFKALLKAVA